MSPTEPQTADCFHRVVHGLTNWVDDGKGNTVPDGCYWYCYDCGVPFRPEAAALPDAGAGLDLDAMRRAIHELGWCKEDRMHAFAHGDGPEDDELRERFAAAYAEGEPTE